MWPSITDKMSEYRRNKPLEELLRKAKKAKRKGFFTQEDIDLAMAEGQIMYDLLFDDSDSDLFDC